MASRKPTQGQRLSHCRLSRNRHSDCGSFPFQASGGPIEPGGRSTFRRIEGDRVRAGSSGLGRLGLGLFALCLVKAVDQRFDDELNRQLVDVLHVLRISVLQCTLHRIQKRFLDFLKVKRLVITVIYEIKIKRSKNLKRKE